MLRRGLSIRSLLLLANLLLLLLPLLSIAGLRLYDVALLRQTERQLIAESVLVGEAFREAYVQHGGPASENYRAPHARHDRYAPVEPMIDVGTPLLDARTESRPGQAVDPIALRAGKQIEAMMVRAQTFNLSGVRVIDGAGCVVATTRSQTGECLDRLPEVSRALRGRYTAVTRERISDEPKPPFGDLRRRGGVRVFIALPVWHGERVIAVVTASRTGLDAWSSLWQNRREIVLIGGSAVMLTLLVVALLSWTIVRPLRRLTTTARAIVAGSQAPMPAQSGWSPSEVKVLASALREMTERLQARAEHAAEQTARVSHELKTPLSAIRGAVELLRDHGGAMSAEQRERFIANIDADAERMERLVTGLLTLARIESEGSKDAPLHDVEAALRSLLARYPDVTVSVTEPLGALAIREDHWASVVLNLVDNARRHGAGQPVQVHARREGARVRLEVTDRGPGISEANRARIFERFFTTERDRGGTGLGLSIVSAIAHARGGDATCNSSEKGTTFVVTL